MLEKDNHPTEETKSYMFGTTLNEWWQNCHFRSELFI